MRCTTGAPTTASRRTSRCSSTTRCRCRTEYVKNNEIVLNIGFDATSALKLGNEFIEFKARFGGTRARDRRADRPRDRDLRARERAGHGLPGAGERAGRRCAPRARPTGTPARPPAARGGPRLARSEGSSPKPPPHRRRRHGRSAARAAARSGPRSSASSSGAAAQRRLYCRRAACSGVRGRAGLAQLVEHPPCKRKVVRSIRTAGTIFRCTEHGCDALWRAQPVEWLRPRQPVDAARCTPVRRSDVAAASPSEPLRTLRLALRQSGAPGSACAAGSQCAGFGRAATVASRRYDASQAADV